MKRLKSPVVGEIWNRIWVGKVLIESVDDRFVIYSSCTQEDVEDANDYTKVFHVETCGGFQLWAKKGFSDEEPIQKNILGFVYKPESDFEEYEQEEEVETT